jgi:hypothetical protein
MKIVAFAILLMFAAGDMSLEDESELTLRQQFAKMKAEMKAEMAMKQAEMKAAMKAEMMAQRSCSMPEGALLTFVDGRTTCPKGYAEPNTTQGMLFVGRPKNATSGAVFNRPLDAGELGRSPAHTHAVTVIDPGHTHVAAVNDPGHNLSICSVDSGGSMSHKVLSRKDFGDFPVSTDSAFTGITVTNAPAKSKLEVSVDLNDAGEHYPLVYVLVCQKLP